MGKIPEVNENGASSKAVPESATPSASKFGSYSMNKAVDSNPPQAVPAGQKSGGSFGAYQMQKQPANDAPKSSFGNYSMKKDADGKPPPSQAVPTTGG